ncbi:MAG: hypothetical protein Kow0037_06680 [Calditrichia bacterium]
MKRWLGIVALAGALSIWMGCSKGQTEAKSMEQIYKESGVPVRTVSLQPAKFEVTRHYFAHLSGIEESVAAAMIGDKVEKILVKVGDYVQKDQVVITFPTDNPGARYYQARVAFQNAERTYRRIKNLYETGGISRQDLDNAKTQYEVAKADWDAVRQAVKVKAPISGYVTRINVRESDNVRAEEALLTVSQTRKLKAKLRIPEQHIGDIKIGQPVVARWMGKEISGKIVQVDIAMDPLLQSFGAVAEFENPDGLIPGGVTAEVIVEAYQNDNALVVESKDVVWEGGTPYVWVAQNGVARKVAIKIGRESEMRIEIVGGVAAGTQIVVEGQMLLENGAKIRVMS